MVVEGLGGMIVDLRVNKRENDHCGGCLRLMPTEIPRKGNQGWFENLSDMLAR